MVRHFSFRVQVMMRQNLEIQILNMIKSKYAEKYWHTEFHLCYHFDIVSLLFNFINYGNLVTFLVISKQKRFFTCHIWNMREALVSWWEKWKKNRWFHVLGLKNMIWVINFFRLSRAVAIERKICATPIQPRP
jgi:hypothetical protein